MGVPIALIERATVSPAAGMKRLPLEVPTDVHAALMDAKAEDGIAAAERIRALLELWRSEPELRDRAQTLGRALAAETERRRHQRNT